MNGKARLNPDNKFHVGTAGDGFRVHGGWRSLRGVECFHLFLLPNGTVRSRDPARKANCQKNSVMVTLQKGPVCLKKKKKLQKKKKEFPVTLRSANCGATSETVLFKLA